MKLVEQSTLADRLEALYSDHREEWRVEKEPHDYPDGTKHFNHVRYKSTLTGDKINVEVASYVTPELGELLCLLHNNAEQIIAALREAELPTIAKTLGNQPA